MSPAVGFLLVLIGIFFFTQATVGGGVDRLLSYVDPDAEPDNAGPRGSVSTKVRTFTTLDRRMLTINAGVPRGDPVVYNTILPAVVASGHRFRCISWYRVGACVKGDCDRYGPSCHRYGKKTGKGAMDLVPRSGDWTDCDELETELRQTPGIGEIVWRGDSDHDPAAGASTPHIHVAVNCG